MTWTYFETQLCFRPSDGVSNEWAIIELQGDLKSHTHSKYDAKFIGDLHFTKTGTPILIIGHHLLYGKEASLDKPLALLQKQHNVEENTEYFVKTIITKKILFKIRPKPIVGNA